MREKELGLAIDDELLKEAQRIGGRATMREYIQRRQPKIMDLFGQIEFDEAYDYEKQRRRT